MSAKSQPRIQDVKYIIVQAGGKGTRLMPLTANKPKAIVPVNNLPIIFNLFKKFSDKKFIIIGDYKFDVLKKYLQVFADVQYLLVKAEGRGTCSGISDSLEYIPDGNPFMLIWSDILLSSDFYLTSLETGHNYVGISKEFECRWSYKNDAFMEKNSKEDGVAGLFVFKDKSEIKGVPEEGEFVKWLNSQSISFKELPLYGSKEFGTLEEYFKLEKKEYRCRPFNALRFESDIVIKQPLDAKGRELAEKECNWYRKSLELGFKQVPDILSFSPLTMKKIRGRHLYHLELTISQKEKLLRSVLEALVHLHDLHSMQPDIFSIQECYYTKTLKRLESVRDLIPFADQEFVTINYRKCRNVFYYKDALEKKIKKLFFSTEFRLIHGDCTFSNILVDENERIVFIDPRGYFGFTEICGDVYYDWAKLYYSVFGNYDQFNQKNFQLVLNESNPECNVELRIQSNGWENVRKCFFHQDFNINEEKVMFIHALIWLSLSTYAWEDYDSICGAFYNGLYYLEEVL